MELAEIRKAVVPVAVLAILGGLSAVGITEEMTVAETVSYAVTSLLVYLIPNKQK